MCESEERIILQVNYVFKNKYMYRLGPNRCGWLRSGRLGCQRLKCRLLKRESNYISSHLKKKKHTGCVQADAEGSDVGGSDVGHWDVRDSR